MEQPDLALTHTESDRGHCSTFQIGRTIKVKSHPLVQLCFHKNPET